MKIYPALLNKYKGVHPVSLLMAKSISALVEGFSITNTITDADFVIVSFPSCNPYEHDFEEAEKLVLSGKKIVFVDDSDNSKCDNENFFNFLSEASEQIKLSFWREFEAYTILPHLKGFILPYEIVGYTDCMTERNMQSFPFVYKDCFYKRKETFCFVGANSSVSRKKVISSLSHNVYDTSKLEDRIPLSKVFEIYKDSKTVFSLEGAGVKCTRHLEAPLTSIMIKEPFSAYPVVYSSPWVDGENCIEAVYDTNRTIDFFATQEKVYNILAEGKGYEIYRNGRYNAENYEIINYYKNYIVKKILEVL